MTRRAGPPSRRDCLRLGVLSLPLSRAPLWHLPLLGAATPLVGLLAGCGLGAAGPRQDFHPLRDAGAAGPAAGAAPASNASGSSAPRIDKVLLLASGAMPGLYDSDRMVFSADGRSRSYFQYGYWSERPAQSLQLLALARLARAQRFRDVALSTSGVRGDLLLTLRLDELVLDVSAEPGQVKLLLNADLVDWRSRVLLARRSFSHSVPVATRDAGGLALAASQALGSILGELVDWAAASASAPSPPAA